MRYPRAHSRPALSQVLRVLVDKATGLPRRPVGAAEVVAAVRAKQHVALSPDCLPAAALPLATLGEHALTLRLDTAAVRGTHTLTVLVKKKL